MGLWEVATGKLLARWPLGEDGIEAVAFSRDARTVFAIGGDELWRLEVASKGVTALHRGSTGDVKDLAAPFDGRFLFAGDGAGQVHRWDLALDAETTPAVTTFSCAALAPNGATVLVGSGQLRIRDSSGERAFSSPEAVGKVAISPDGGTLVTGDRILQAWSLRSHAPLGELPDDGFPPWYVVGNDWVAFGRYVDWSLHRAISSADAFLEGEPIVLPAPCSAGTFAALARSGDGGKLALAYGPGFERGECEQTDDGPAPEAPPDSNDPYRVLVFETDGWSIIARRTAAGDQVPSLAFEPGGDVLALGTKAGIELWSTVSGRTLRTLPVEAELVRLAFVPDRKWLAVGSGTGKLTVYDYGADRLVAEFDAHHAAIRCLDASTSRLVSTGFEGTVALWSLGRP